MKKISIIPILCLCSGVAFSNIASTEYVNSEKTKLDTAISGKMDVSGYTASRAMLTSNSGVPTSGQISGTMMGDGTITADKIATGAVDNNAIDDGAVELNKFSLTFPTSGKHILTWDNATNSYKFEMIRMVGDVVEDCTKITNQCDETPGCFSNMYGYSDGIGCIYDVPNCGDVDNAYICNHSGFLVSGRYVHVQNRCKWENNSCIEDSERFGMDYMPPKPAPEIIEEPIIDDPDIIKVLEP